eukprot:m.21941 g.21941  ORF g.21941 m.21941 type:complete len:226 (-) comp7291_c0_seq1:298-975(-)
MKFNFALVVCAFLIVASLGSPAGPGRGCCRGKRCGARQPCQQITTTPEPAPSTTEVDVQGRFDSIGECTSNGVELMKLLNDLRESQGLSRLQMSQSMCKTAQLHVVDHLAYPPASGCNLHSWSGNIPPATSVCYTADHSQASQMWNKPMQITDWVGNGFEIAAKGFRSAEEAIHGWVLSAPHRQVMLSEGIWSSHIKVGGAAYNNGFYCIWFGDRTSDPWGLTNI